MRGREREAEKLERGRKERECNFENKKRNEMQSNDGMASLCCCCCCVAEVLRESELREREIERKERAKNGEQRKRTLEGKEEKKETAKFFSQLSIHQRRRIHRRALLPPFVAARLTLPLSALESSAR